MQISRNKVQEEVLQGSAFVFYDNYENEKIGISLSAVSKSR